MIQYNEIITFNECTNSGNRVYAYYNHVVGAMEAYAYSAYLAAKLVKGVLCLWSDEMQMPCAVLRKQQMEELLKNGEVAEEISVDIVQLNLSAPEAYNKDGYDLWLRMLKARKTKVAHPLPVDEVLSTAREFDNANENHKPLMGSVRRNIIVVLIVVLFIICLVLLAIIWGGGNINVVK